MSTPASSALWPLGGDPGYISPPPAAVWASSDIRRVTVLGCTGSIGRSALDLAEKYDNIRVCALGAGKNVELLAAQAIRFQPQWLAVLNEELAADLRRILPPGYSPKIVWGSAGYAALASLPDASCVLSAQSGVAGLTATLTAALAGKVVALANKESLVVAGGLLRRICARTGASILPVDSEHFALFQCLAARHLDDVNRLLLTASGGPFLHKTKEEMARATPDQALLHPNWRMGAKISIDSATMMNKGLELIEAVQLFGIPPERVRILIQPQSLVHSMVEYADNGILAQLAVADMRLPIVSCLLWPQVVRDAVKPLDFTAIGHLDFLEPDLEKFRCLGLARDALAYKAVPWRELGLNPACIILNGANETAVNLFLRGRVALGAIPALVESALKRMLPGLTPPAPPEFADPCVQAKAVAEIIDQLTLQVRQYVEALASPAGVFG